MKAAAILLSAGLSSRMGEFKPLLPIGAGAGRSTVLERSVRLFRGAGIEDIHVVTGHRAQDLEATLAQLEVQPVFNPDFQEGMFSSVLAGLQSLAPGVEAFFLLPIDVPLVRPQTLEALLAVPQEAGRQVVYPTFQGERGHPPRISTSLRGSIESWKGDGGLKGILAQFEDSALEVEVADQGILWDMDTPADYLRLLKRSARLPIPTPEECHVLLESILKVPGGICRHSAFVAKLAALLGAELNRGGLDLDLELLTSAGLLHDLARTERDHARRGAQYLREHGFEPLAPLVAAHTDLPLDKGGPVTPEEVLYLADKLAQGETLVSLQQRFHEALQKHAEAPGVLAKVQARLETAQIVQTRIEKAMGRSVPDVLKAL